MQNFKVFVSGMFLVGLFFGMRKKSKGFENLGAMPVAA
jgi:hypothetical protein